MVEAAFPSIPAWPSSQFCGFWLLVQLHGWKAQSFMMQLGTERHYLLPPRDGPLHLAEDLSVVKTPQQSACSQPSPPPG